MVIDRKTRSISTLHGRWNAGATSHELVVKLLATSWLIVDGKGKSVENKWKQRPPPTASALRRSRVAGQHRGSVYSTGLRCLTLHWARVMQPEFSKKQGCRTNSMTKSSAMLRVEHSNCSESALKVLWKCSENRTGKGGCQLRPKRALAGRTGREIRKKEGKKRQRLRLYSIGRQSKTNRDWWITSLSSNSIRYRSLTNCTSIIILLVLNFFTIWRSDCLKYIRLFDELNRF